MIKQIKACNTIEELDALRNQIVIYAKSRPGEFRNIQKEFVKKKNQLKRE